MKKNDDLGLFPREWLKKIFFVMRLTGFFCLMCVLQVSAKVNAQNIRFDLRMENVTIEQVFHRITESTKLDFFYNNSRIDVYEKIDVNLSNVSIAEALKAIFKGKDVKFDVTDKFVVIHSVQDAVNMQNQVKPVTVQGVVKSSKGETLPGVTIRIKGTQIGSVSDIDGKFSLTVPAMEDIVLVFSFVGLESCEIRQKQLTASTGVLAIIPKSILMRGRWMKKDVMSINSPMEK